MHCTSPPSSPSPWGVLILQPKWYPTAHFCTLAPILSAPAWMFVTRSPLKCSQKAQMVHRVLNRHTACNCENLSVLRDNRRTCLLKKKSHSCLAVCVASDPWQAFRVLSLPKRALMLPGAAWRATSESVGPSRLRHLATAPAGTESTNGYPQGSLMCCSWKEVSHWSHPY